MKKINWLGFLSLLALLGFLGFFTDNKGLFGAFGFAYYLRYFFVNPDELFLQNVRRAATLGFFAQLVAVGVAVVIRVLFPAWITGSVALATCFAVSVFCFTIAITVFELRETRLS